MTTYGWVAGWKSGTPLTLDEGEPEHQEEFPTYVAARWFILQELCFLAAESPDNTVGNAAMTAAVTLHSQDTAPQGYRQERAYSVDTYVYFIQRVSLPMGDTP